MPIVLIVTILSLFTFGVPLAGMLLFFGSIYLFFKVMDTGEDMDDDIHNILRK